MGFEAMPMRFYTIAAEPRAEATATAAHLPVCRDWAAPADMPARTSLRSHVGHAGRATNPSGAFTYLATDNMASGSISTYVYQHYVHQYLAGYLQDDWKLTQKLTLNLGLRYEYFTPKLEQGRPVGELRAGDRGDDLQRRHRDGEACVSAESAEPEARPEPAGAAHRG